MKPIFPPGAGKTLAPYSPGAMADGVVYVAGTLALDPRYCIQCGLVKKEALVEIATIAHIGK
jgi:enamine deaminase RidA (YjgF/YER057c/UK114 family)